MNITFAVMSCLLLVHEASPRIAPDVLPVWPGATVGDFGRIGPERVRDPDDAPTKDATWITNVTKPTIHVFRPPAETNTGVAMVICPGGGYWNLAWDLEGEEVAAWLNENGITGVVLKYRVPRRPGQPEVLPAPGPLLDAQRAMSLVRSRAKEWAIDADRIGIVGFSAGGHLAVSTGTNFDRRAYEPIDDVDKVSCRPDFVVSIYPGYLVPEDQDTSDALADDVRIPEGTPRMFFVHANDDPESSPMCSVSMYAALRRAGVPSELHIYPTGGHGYGVRRRENQPCTTWPDRCIEWLKAEGILRGVEEDEAKPGTVQRLPVLPEGETGIAARYPGDHGIERDESVLFADGFETGDPRDRWDHVYHQANIRLAEEAANVHSGEQALEFTVPRQPAEVSNELVKLLGKGHDTVFLRYYSKFDEGFDQTGSSHNGGILTAVSEGLPYATPGVRADGRNKFLASLENWREDPATPSPGELNVYCYHPGQRSQWGDHFFPSGRVLPNSSIPGDFGSDFAARPEITQELGRWHCYELMLKANSLGRSDGRIACWLDGVLVADFPNLRLRDDAALKINHAMLDLHIGSNRRRVNRKWYDDVVIATRYIGPMRPDR